MPEPVVLLHAFPLGPGMWEGQVEALSDRWQVVTPDLDFTLYPSMDAMADAVVAQAAGLGLDRFVLGGLSMGGYVSFALLRRHAGVVRALILADTRAGPDSDEIRQRRTRQQAQVGEAGSAQPVIDAMLDALPGPYTKEHRPEAVARIASLMSAASTPERVVAALEAMKARPDSTADLARIDVPALVIAGEEDAVSPPAVAEDMAERLPAGRLAVLPQAGHLPNLETPDAFNAELRRFLDSLQEGGV